MLSCRVVRTVDSLTLVGLNPTPVHWHRRIKRKRRERLADNGPAKPGLETLSVVTSLPTVRTEAVRLAEIADRERQTHVTIVECRPPWRPT